MSTEKTSMLKDQYLQVTIGAVLYMQILSAGRRALIIEGPEEMLKRGKTLLICPDEATESGGIPEIKALIRRADPINGDEYLVEFDLGNDLFQRGYTLVKAENLGIIWDRIQSISDSSTPYRTSRKKYLETLVENNIDRAESLLHEMQILFPAWWAARESAHKMTSRLFSDMSLSEQTRYVEYTIPSAGDELDIKA